MILLIVGIVWIIVACIAAALIGNWLGGDDD